MFRMLGSLYKVEFSCGEGLCFWVVLVAAAARYMSGLPSPSRWHSHIVEIAKRQHGGAFARTA